MKTYNKRTWLNPETSSSTSNIVAFDGDVDYGKEIFRDTFLQIADCHHIIRLHKKDTETTKEFIDKLNLLKSEIELFINHLNN